MLFFLLAPRAAAAFADSPQFFDAPGAPHAATTGASGEGVYFTGAPRFASLDCASCHTDGPGRAQLKLGADTPSLFTEGYVPGQTYALEVELLNELEGIEHDGPATCTDPPTRGDTFSYVQCNNNNFALEIDSVDGPLPSGLCAAAPSGGACPAPRPSSDESVVAPGGDAVFGNRARSAGKVVARNDPTRWHFFWTAPPAGTGPLTIYVSLVDGNGGDGTPADDQDPLGDDTVTAAITVGEQGGAALPSAQAGCAAAPGRATGAPLFVVFIGALLLLLLLRRRRWS